MEDVNQNNKRTELPDSSKELRANPALNFIVQLNYIFMRHPKRLLFGTFAVIMILATSLVTLKLNPTPFLIDRDHPSRVADRDLQEMFANSGVRSFITVVTKEDSIFNEGTLSTVDQITKLFEDFSLIRDHDKKVLAELAVDEKSQQLVDAILEGGINYLDYDNLNSLESYFLELGAHRKAEAVEDIRLLSNVVKRVDSLTTIEDLQDKDDVLDVHKVMDGIPKTPQEMAKLKQSAMSNHMIIDRFISEDGKATIVQVELSMPQDDAPKQQLWDEMSRQVLAKIQTQDRILVVGQPALAAQLSNAIEKDNQVFFPFVILIIGLVLFVSFFKFQAIFIPLLISVLTIVTTVSIMALLNIKINAITSSLPVMLVAIAVADSIHFMASFYGNLEKGLKREEAAITTLKELFLPLLMTSVTTLLGFIALSITELTFIREFGLFVALGVAFAFTFTVGILPPLLVWLNKDGATNKHKVSPFLAKIDHLSVKVNDALIKRPKSLILFWLVALCVVVFVASHLKIDNSNIEAFDKDSALRVHQDAFVKHFGGAYPINIKLTSESDRAFTQPEYIEGMNKMQGYIEKNFTGQGTVFSAVDFVKRSNQVLNNGAFELPHDLTPELIGQYYFLYEGSERRDLYSVVDADYQNARMVVLANTDNSIFWDTFIKDVGVYSATVLPSDVKIQFSGFGEYMVSNVLEIVNTQVTSICIALALISIVLIIQFRSFIVGMVTSIPLILTLAGNFALMVSFNMSLDIGTALVSSVAFGIGVDYSIHYTAALKRALAENMEELGELNYPLALQKTFQSVARPIIVNSISLALGILVLLMSSYAVLANLGILVASTLFVCSILTLLVLPPLFILLQPKALAPREVLVQEADSEILADDSLEKMAS